MAELPDQLQRDLAALRVRAGPPAGAQRRVLASIEAAGFDLGSDPDLDLDPDPDPGSVADAGPDPGLAELGTRAGDTLAQLSWSAKVVAVTLALTGAGLLAVRGAVLLTGALAPAPADDSALTDGLAPELGDSSADELADATGPAPTVTPEPTAPAPTIQTPSPARALAKPRALESAPSDTLAAELALLESARDRTDPAAALERLRRHEREFPEGALALERDLLVIESLCALGQFEQARARDRELRLAHGDSPQRAKLRKVCPELGRE